MIQSNRKIGLGSLSLLLFIMGILFSVSFKDQPAYGDQVLKVIGLPAWSNGDTGIHYTVFYSLIFFVTAIILAYKRKKDIGATTGGILSLIILMVIVGFMMSLSF